MMRSALRTQASLASAVLKRAKSSAAPSISEAPTYGVLPDGRQSLRAHLFGHNSHTFAKNWLQDPSTYPIMAIMVGAISMLTIAASNTLLHEPDVCLDRGHRSQLIRDNYEEGAKWEHSGLKKYLVGKDSSHNSLFNPVRTISNAKKEV
jgi:hypothetical protein